MAAQDGGRPNQTVNSPFFLVPLLLGIGMIFATAVWMGARREAAALYGIIRSIEAPFVNKLAPHAKYFSIESLKEVVPVIFNDLREQPYVRTVLYGADIPVDDNGAFAARKVLHSQVGLYQE